MRTAKDFKRKNSPQDAFIENEIYPLLDENEGSATLYLNVIIMEGIDLKQLKIRLKELNFKISTGKEGVDDVLYINA